MDCHALRRRATLLSFLLAISLLTGGCAGSEEQSGALSPPRLVLLISLDTLRADRLGGYGHDRGTSPWLDRLARSAVTFTTAGVQVTHTLPSHKSLFTGKFPYRLLGEAVHADLPGLARLRDGARFLEGAFARIDSGPLLQGMRQAGYRTVGYTDGAWMSRDMGFDSGFDRFDDRGGHLAGILPRLLPTLESLGLQPTFLFLHTYDIHCPYTSRAPYDDLYCRDHSTHVPLEGRCGYVLGKPPLMEATLTVRDYDAISDHYDQGIASTDDELGGLLRTLRRLDLSDEALIVVTSDHGEAVGEHGHVGHGALHLEQLKVPLIVKFPESWDVAPRTVTEPVALLDVLPTLLDVCGAQIPPGLDGHSLLPMVNGESGSRRELVTQIAFHEGPMATPGPAKRAILVPDRWLLISDAADDSIELYDLTTDAAGLTPVRQPDPAIVTDLLERLRAYDAGKSDAQPLTPEVAHRRDKTRRELESLGYVGG